MSCNDVCVIFKSCFFKQNLNGFILLICNFYNSLCKKGKKETVDYTWGAKMHCVKKFLFWYLSESREKKCKKNALWLFLK